MRIPRFVLDASALLGVTALAWGAAQSCRPPGETGCTEGTVRAQVVALDQPLMLNRLGSYIPDGLIFALESDVVALEGSSEPVGPGNAALRPGKRPRPLVLRVNQGQCLDIRLRNYVTPVAGADQNPATRSVSVHVDGLEWRRSAEDDGSFVGRNASSVLAPSATESLTYRLFAREQGTFLLYSTAAMVGTVPGPNFFPVGGQLSQGLFGAVHVEPEGAEWYRSQVTRADLDLASGGKRSPDGHPMVDYTARYPDDPARYGKLAGKPILAMIDAEGEIVYSDLTAIITGPDQGDFKGESPTFAKVAASPERRQPYREFTIIYHEVKDAVVQAFNEIYTPSSTSPVPDQLLATVLRSGEDAFGINYGVTGIGNEILANRFEVGAMRTCAECKFEEFFLSAWAVGDPALVVDTPTWTPNGAAHGQPRPEAVVSYPDDPSNVYHSYLWDHVKFRVLHGGASLHHLHHQHAHQWLHTPNADNSHYLDSQAIGPGSGYTLEMVYNSSGNKNLTVGDSIFHCHFYPHFAQGMWGLWRVHDVFEEGSPLDAQGRPTGRALPDGEILAGTPIPALVPLPTRAMAPMPAPVRIDPATGQIDRSIWAGGVPEKNPGFPFFIPGIAGSRAPHPPLDLAFDGGLPRHVVERDGNQWTEQHTYQNFEKTTTAVNARWLDENGEPAERVAMAYHAKRLHPSYTPEGAASPFVTNGLEPTHGAPYADPCVDLEGQAAGVTRVYKAANFQHDVVLSKEGWHFPQLRMLALWEDVVPTLHNERPPQPFFFRANSSDCITYMHTNLVPDYYELDDFQVRTPTDILGQHIHLVKFDVTSSDGAGNGWNYEDGAFSPDEVRSRIAAINSVGGLLLPDGRRKQLTAEPHPYFGRFKEYSREWLGAQTEYQRWYADPLLNNEGQDRTLRTVFTHDHFSPSTHQQAGLYAGLLVEPEGSTFWDPATDQQLSPRLTTTTGPPNPGARLDGGPTSWQATIETDPAAESYREFGLAFQDIQLAYQAGYGYPRKDAAAAGAPEHQDQGQHYQYGTNYENFQNAVNPPNNCSSTGQEQTYAPCPQLVSDFVLPSSFWNPGQGAVSVNYRAEPVTPRLAAGASSSGLDPTDPANVFLSIERPYAGTPPYVTINTQQPAVGSPGNQGPSAKEPLLTPGMGPTDPYTPLLRTYMGDRVEIAALAGAHLDIKNFTLHGLRWRAERHYANSGFRASQAMGLSEHFEFDFETPVSEAGEADYLYMTGAATSDIFNGNWGLLRAYREQQSFLRRLPNNEPGKDPVQAVCPEGAPRREVEVWAIDAGSIVPGGNLVYSDVGGNQVVGTASVMYVLNRETLDGVDLGGDIDHSGATPVLKADIETPYPLVLRAAAGDCLKVTLVNKIDQAKVLAALEAAGVENQTPSFQAGLHAQLLSFDVTVADGFNAGLNPVQTVAIGDQKTFTWYAGLAKLSADGKPEWIPVEFGSANLMAADPLYQQTLGLGGALVVEPLGAHWKADAGNRTAATVYADGLEFREFVVVTQNDLTLGYKGQATKCAPPPTAVNYRSAPLFLRDTAVFTDPFCSYESHDISAIFSNTASAVGGQDPTSPIFSARPGVPVRIRLLNPGSTNQNEVFTLNGHVWQEEPYVNASRAIGDNPLSNYFGSWAGHGAGNHYDVVLPSAGGAAKVPGDYLYRTFNLADLAPGMWGILRVEGAKYEHHSPNQVTVEVTGAGAGRSVAGRQTPDEHAGKAPGGSSRVYVFGGEVDASGTGCTGAFVGTTEVAADGTWELGPLPATLAGAESVCAKSAGGGVAAARL